MKKIINSNKELRIYTMPVEIRGEKDSRNIGGYALKFNMLSRNLGWFKEQIAPSAFDDIDFADQDIVALFNHNENLILARSNESVKTLNLEVDTTGLKFDFDSPNTTAGNDAHENVRIGNIQHCSFAFAVAEDGQKWTEDENGDSIRTITKFSRIYDVSIVVNPAYLQTEVDVAKRSFDEYKKTTETPDESIKTDFEKRKRIIELNKHKKK